MIENKSRRMKREGNGDKRGSNMEWTVTGTKVGAGIQGSHSQGDGTQGLLDSLGMDN